MIIEFKRFLLIAASCIGSIIELSAIVISFTFFSIERATLLDALLIEL